MDPLVFKAHKDILAHPVFKVRIILAQVLKAHLALKALLAIQDILAILEEWETAAHSAARVLKETRAFKATWVWRGQQVLRERWASLALEIQVFKEKRDPIVIQSLFLII